MITLINYTEYMLDRIMEAVRVDQIRLVLSDRLKELLSSIDHPVAQDILAMESEGDKAKVTYIDIDNSDGDKLDSVSFMTAAKAVDFVSDKMGLERDKNTISRLNSGEIVADKDVYGVSTRSTTKIGRIVRKLFGDKYKDSGDAGNDIESFVDEYKSLRSTSNIEEVIGEDIAYWYLEDRYTKGEGPMNKSCMRGEEEQDFIYFYAENPNAVSLLILRDQKDKNKIRGRALLWKLTSPHDRYFMDRIYYVSGYEKEVFKRYAKEHGYLMKSKQSYDEGVSIVDTKTGEISALCMSVYINWGTADGPYPFLDTMMYLDRENHQLCNMKECLAGVATDVCKLQETDGECERVDICEYWSTYYDECLDDAMDSGSAILCEIGDDYRYDTDCYFSDYYEEWVADDYAEQYMEQIDLCDDSSDSYRFSRDIIYTHEGSSTDEKYASENLTYSEFYGEYIEDAVWSEYYSDYIAEEDAVFIDSRQDHVLEEDAVYCPYCGEHILKEDAVEVCVTPECNNTEYFSDDDEDVSWWEADDGNKYSMDIKKEDIE